MTKDKDPNEPNRDHPETTDDRPGDNPQAAKEEAENLRPNPRTRDHAENIFDSEFEAADERDLEPQERQAPPLTEPGDNAKVDRVIPDEAHAGAVVPQAREYLVSPRVLRNLFIASNVVGVLIIVVILTLASSSDQARYTPADETQYQRTLVEATDAIGITALNEGGETARIPIEEAIALVAERGVAEVSATLAAPPAAAAADAAPAEEAAPSPPVPPGAPDTTGVPVPQGADPAAESPGLTGNAEGENAAGGGGAQGNAGNANAAAPPAAAAPIDTAAGEAVYTANCASCHQATGEGVPGAFPTLVGHVPSLYNADRSYLINLLLYGLQGEIQVEGQTYNGVMPAWAQLSDDDIANVLNYTSTAWGNDAQLQNFQPYTAEDVAPLRDAGLSSADVYALRQELGLSPDQ